MSTPSGVDAIESFESIVPSTTLQSIRLEKDAIEDAFRLAGPLSLHDDLDSNERLKTDNPRKRVLDPFPRPLNRVFGIQVAAIVEGQKITLSKLVVQLKKKDLFGDDDVDIKVLVCDIASRKYYGLKAGKEEQGMTAFEDESRAPFWFWELRTLSLLSEERKSRAIKERQRRKQMQDRLQALVTIIRLSESVETKWTAVQANKTKKAMEKLDRTVGLQSINEKFNEENDYPSMKRAEKRAKREMGSDVSSSARKERGTEAKMAAASGFASVRSLKTAQKRFRSFFNTPVKSPTREQKMQPQFVMAGKSVLPCQDNRRLVFTPGDVHQMDAGLASHPSLETVKEAFMKTCEGLRDHGKSKMIWGDDGYVDLHHGSCKGAPAAWARRPGHALNVETECEKCFGQEWRSLNIVPARKKFLWFLSDSDCPPYFGQITQAVKISSRNPFLKADGLNYEDLFDEGWQEDPDGESLSVSFDDSLKVRIFSKAEEEEDEDHPLSDDDEAFVVEDGYLSADEGIDGEMDVDDSVSDAGSLTSANDCPSTGAASKKAIERCLMQCSKTGQPLVFACIPVVPPQKREWVLGDQKMLEELKALHLSKEMIRLDKSC